MKLKILILCVAVFPLSIFLLSRYYSNAEQKSISKNIANIESLIKTGKEVTAEYDSVYSEFKRNGQVLRKYIKYSFVVNGKKFEDEKTIWEFPNEPSFTLVYLPSNPALHSENPKKDLENLKAKKNEENSPFWPWTMFIGSISIFFITRRSYLQEIKEEKENERFYRELNNPQ